MSAPPSILFLATGLGFGGAERELTQLARGLAARGHRVAVASLIEPSGFADELRAAAIPVHSLGMRRGRPSLGGILRLRRLLRDFRPDILHSFMVHANLLARSVRLIASVPVLISTAQNLREGGRFFELAYRASDRLADLTTQVSEAGAERYLAVGAVPAAERLRVIPNSVDLERFQPDAAARSAVRAELGAGGALVLLAVGRLEPQKDYPTLLRAFATFAPGRDAVLWICGQGELRAELEALAAGLGLAGRVRFLGLRRDVERVANGADVFVMSSAWEGLPLALLEAAASGLPAVVTAVGGNAEVVEAGSSGWLVPRGDAAAFAAALSEVAELGAAERRATGQRLAARVRALYSLAACLERWQALYAELLARAGRAHVG